MLAEGSEDRAVHGHKRAQGTGLSPVLLCPLGHGGCSVAQRVFIVAVLWLRTRLWDSARNEGLGDGWLSDASSLHADLSNLVTWAHTHGAICGQMPELEMVQNTGHPRKKNSVLWMCGAGHAYYWQCGRLEVRSRDKNEGVKRRRRPVSSDASLREANLDEKRLRMMLSLERAKADAAHAESCSRSPGVTQQNSGAAFAIHSEPSPRERRNQSKPVKSCAAAEQSLSALGGEVNTDRSKVKLESDNSLQIVSGGEQHVSDEDDRGDRTNQNVLSQSPVMGVTAEVDLQRHCHQKMTFNEPPAAQASGFSPAGKRPLTPACVPKSAGSSQESLTLSPPDPAWFIMETSMAGNSLGSAAPKECLKPDPVSSAEAVVQPESPTSVTFFFKTESPQDIPQLSLLECGSSGKGFCGNVAEQPMEEAGLSGSGSTPHPPTTASKNVEHPPTSSSKSVMEKLKRKKTGGNIKVFKDWMVLHHPSETRNICELSPEDLDRYLASFYTSAKRQDGSDFSASSLHFFQLSIARYLQEHSYRYSVVKGLEFRASQEALRQRQQVLSQRVREEEWNVLGNLTEKEVDGLRKKGLLSKMQPEGLLHLMLINIIRGFGARVDTWAHDLRWGHLVLRGAEGQLEFLEWRDNPSDDPTAGPDPEEPGLRLFANPDDPEHCPVADYKEYARRRPLSMNRNLDPLYLTPSPLWSIWDQAWYCRKALSKAKLEKMLKVIIQQVRGAGRRPKN
ncbi:PREDICTED: uncharacterized protein LOC104491517 [Buceros rhinoceros silvestris]|uniref:uncharacterized protein LOC104491517 n=1 Tax=Buceros rhinoceros silvestris TaxID=175836 RepID=UPI000528C4A6|nr:PREDICTED: uncharacterized protein LOC104491517 [Buceros rhinoceros silvestris]